MKIHNWCRIAAIAGIAMSSILQPAAAQDPVQREVKAKTGVNATPAQILERLKASGISRADMQNRLRQAGYDARLLDAYYDQLEKNPAADKPGLSPITKPLPPPTNSFMAALSRIGLAPEQQTEELKKPEADSAGRSVQDMASTKPTAVFGRSMFSAGTSQFDPDIAGPVDAEYQIGPGDQLTLVITGDVELAYTLDVTRDGYVVIPDVGQIFVNGRTLGELKDVLYDRLGRVYSGVSRSPSASTRFDVSVSRVRSLLVYLIGDVVRPGAYQVSAVSKAFNALYRAGGPSDQGSFRSIEIRRGGRTISTIDIYDYLLRGDTRNDIRLTQGDIIFVPPAITQVEINGSVRRPGIYELKDNEGLLDLMAFAGGVSADAFVNRIQIDRILPYSQRQPGRERVLVDVDLRSLLEQRRNIAVNDGDKVKIFGVSDERRNRVTISGDVGRPGDYEYRAGSKVSDLIREAQGLLPTAYTPTAHLLRRNLTTGRLELVRVAFGDSAGRASADSIPLHDLDEVVVYGRPELLNRQTVAVAGLVKRPGLYPLAQGMSVADLVLAAGGFTPGATDYEAEIARMVSRPERGDTLSVIMRVPLDIDPDPSAPRNASGALPFPLKNGDNVFIRQLAGHTPVETVEVTGEVLYPGEYALERRTQTLSSIVRRAGGVAPEAYVPGFRLVRQGKPVAADLKKALENPGGEFDLGLEPGDRLEVPPYDPTVLVTGAVAFEARVPYRKGASVSEYLNKAGGLTEKGDRRRVSVRYANGEINAVHRALLARMDPDVKPGSTIYVPERSADSKFNWDNFLSKTLAVFSTLATVTVAARSLR